ncbi:DUF3885 domain-containing protein [Dyadobacter sp. BHUBP1]|uniref:DUF3885 domain-containing protein n=1 Tax=Dyadobacter sp. BHUBP1 TaxID=3424178 RepID=UPI003D32F232
MKSTTTECRQFLNDNFKGLRFKMPLFYSWNHGLRFDLQSGDTSTDEYFKEVIRRASIIFQTAFSRSDNVYLVMLDWKYKRRKIRFGNFTFKQISNLNKSEVYYSKETGLYSPKDKFDVAIIKLTSDRINLENIFAAIGHSDFPPRQPRLDNNRSLTSKEVYFLNIEKKLILHMYDDRGLDIIAADRQTLRSIYERHNDLILSYDRERIDKQFE